MIPVKQRGGVTVTCELKKVQCGARMTATAVARGVHASVTAATVLGPLAVREKEHASVTAATVLGPLAVREKEPTPQK